MPNIYIVTRYVTNAKLGTPIPNLGVHTSKAKAIEHYRKIIEDRKRLGAKVLYENEVLKIDQYNRDLMEATIDNANGEGFEKLRIEVWKV